MSDRDFSANKMIANLLINVLSPLMKKDKNEYTVEATVILPNHIAALAYGVIDKKITFQQAKETVKELYSNLKESVNEMSEKCITRNK